jgi:CRP-like cAMP-binding protein
MSTGYQRRLPLARPSGLTKGPHMEIHDALQQIPLFAEVNKTDLETLAASTRIESFKTGQVILREGRVGAAFYIILSGKVEVIKEMATAEPTVLSTLNSGDFFGEIAAMKHVSRTASVKALEDTQCLVIRRLGLDCFIERYPMMASRVGAVLSARLG